MSIGSRLFIFSSVLGDCPSTGEESESTEVGTPLKGGMPMPRRGAIDYRIDGKELKACRRMAWLARGPLQTEGLLRSAARSCWYQTLMKFM